MLGLGREAGLFLKGTGSTAIQALWPRGRLLADQTRAGQGTAPGRPLLCRRTASLQLFRTFLWKEDLLQEAAQVHFLPHMGKDGEDSRAAVLKVWRRGAAKS